MVAATENPKCDLIKKCRPTSKIAEPNVRLGSIVCGCGAVHPVDSRAFVSGPGATPVR